MLTKPLYINPNDGEPDEMSPTADTFAIAQITLNTAPANATDAATKAYVDAAVAGIAVSKTVEVTCPAYGVSEMTQTFSDASVTANSGILISISGAAPTGKDADELEMDNIFVKALAQAGALQVYIRGLEGNIHGAFRFCYVVGL